jgi:hypothetical protein
MKTEIINMEFNDKQYNFIKKASKKLKLTVEDFLRMVIYEMIKVKLSSKKRLSKKEKEQIAYIEKEYKRMKMTEKNFEIFNALVLANKELFKEDK